VRAAALAESRRLCLAWGLGALLAAGATIWGVETLLFRAELSGANDDLAHSRPGQARDRLARLAKRRPGRSDVALSLGLSEQAIGRIDEALAAWGQIAPGSSDAGPIALRRAKLAMEHGRLAVAEESVERALAEGGVNHDEALSFLARVLRLQGRLSNLRPRLIDGLRQSVVPAELLREIWRLDSEPLPVEGIRAFLDWAGQQATDDDRVWLGQARLAIQTGANDEAEVLLDRCERRRPDDPAIVRARLDLAVASDDPAAARRALGRSAMGPIRLAEAAALRAWFAVQSGDRAAERVALEEWVRDDPGNTEALERLVRLDQGSPRVPELRRRKSELDQARDGYKRLLARGDLSTAREISRLAGLLGRRVEEQGWAYLAANPRHDTPRVRAALARIVADQPRALTASRILASLPSEPAFHPARVPASPGLIGSLPSFVDDAERDGLIFTFDNGQSRDRQSPESVSGGVGLLDYDGDGWLDVYCVQGGPFPPRPGQPATDRLFHNTGRGTFEDATVSAGIAGLPGGYGHGVTVGDYDNDGRPDLFLTRFGAYALLHNRGDGTFEEATAVAGLGGPRGWPTSAAFADLDGDGDLDLYVCHYLQWNSDNPRICRDLKTGAPFYCEPITLSPCPDHVFRNDGGRFVDVTDAAGIVDLNGRGLGVVVADLDDDGRVDLFVANDMTANYLFRNRGGFRFEEIGQSSGVASNAGGGYQAGMGVACGDLDGDGRPDLVVTNFYGESTTFYRNLGPGLFADQTAAVGLASPTRFVLGFGVAFLDTNNDGHLDLLQTNGHVNDFRPDTPYAMSTQLFLGNGPGRLTNVTDRAEGPFTVPRVGRGLAVGDLDNDGRLDVLVTAHDRPLAYFHNQSTRAGHFVTIQLVGTASNRDGVGAKVTLKVGGKRQVAQRVGGSSYQSAQDGRLHFGLGAMRRIEAVEVAWPSGRVDRHFDLEADIGYRLREGDSLPSRLAGFCSN
jgi:enediyne biosynthesis protein E4